MKNKKVSDMLISGAIQIVPFSDKILYEDNDGDGIPNKDDPYPDEPFDDRFEIVNDFSYEPSIDFVDRHYENSQKCYGKLNEPNVLGRAIAIMTIAIQDSDSFAKFVSPVVNQTGFDFGLHPERENDSSALFHAFGALRHYYWGNGKKVYYSESDICELISSSDQNLTHLLNNINRTMRCAEEILNDGENIVICPKSDQKFKAICLVKKKYDEETAPIDRVECDIDWSNLSTEHAANYCNYVHRDWNLTIGESLGTIITKIERNDKRFTMHYRYYIKDIYEWAYHYEAYDPYGLSNILHSAHEAKVAQEYLIQGYFEGYLSWDLGDIITERAVADQIFTTLADKEGGFGNIQSVILGQITSNYNLIIDTNEYCNQRKNISVNPTSERAIAFYWTLKIVDNNISEIWTCKIPLNQEQLKPYSFDEQLEMIPIFKKDKFKYAIGYYKVSEL